MTAARIRVAGPSDVPALFDIRLAVEENAMTPAELAAAGVTSVSVADALGAETCGWIAEVAGKPAGFAMVDSEAGSVFAMFVLPTFQDMGIGRALMREAEKSLFRNHAKIWLTTGAQEHIRAHGFYRRLGWQAAGFADNGEVRYEKSRSVQEAER